MKYKLAIFDLDGTILNTLDDLHDSVNYALSKNGFPNRTLDEVRTFVGNGIRKLIERAMPQDAALEATDKVFSDFNYYYKLNSSNKTRPYDGINALISRLREFGVKTAVLTNKADYAAQDLCAEHFPNLFDYVAGEKRGVNRKPAPDGVINILKQLNIDKSDAVYIGDSEVDVMTAQNSELDHIIVTWGFRDREELIKAGAKVIADTPNDVLDIITR